MAADRSPDGNREHVSTTPHELQVLQIYPEDFEPNPLLQYPYETDYGSFGGVLQTSPPMTPVPTVVQELRQNGGGGGGGRHSIVKQQSPSYSMFDQQPEIVDQASAIPSTVEEVAVKPDIAVTPPSPTQISTFGADVARPSTSRRRKVRDKRSKASTDKVKAVSVASAPSSAASDPQTESAEEPRKSYSGTKSLPEFLLKTLNNSKYNPTVIKWEDANTGVFRIVRGSDLARLWRRSRKKSAALKYEFFARAMRYYYKRGYIKRVEGRKLLYQFQEKYHWRRDPQSYPFSLSNSSSSSDLDTLQLTTLSTAAEATAAADVVATTAVDSSESTSFIMSSYMSEPSTSAMAVDGAEQPESFELSSSSDDGLTEEIHV